MDQSDELMDRPRKVEPGTIPFRGYGFEYSKELGGIYVKAVKKGRD